MKIFALLFPLWVVAAQSVAYAGSELLYPREIRQQLGLERYSTDRDWSRLKIAVLDNGFAGFIADGDTLPVSAELIPGPQNDFAPTSHGLGMAQIVWALTGKTPQGPKFYLINANGYTNFKAAIDVVIQKQVDVVLYSQVWPFGSNFNGQGLIDQEVSRATRTGVIWVNAAGNYGKMVFNQKVLKVSNFLRFTNRWDENTVHLTLSWNDFAGEAYTTNKDLNLYVYDANGKQVGASELIQRGEAPSEGGNPQLSSYPREAITLRGLARGDYRVEIRRQSQNFVSSDHLRLILRSEKAEGVVFLDRTLGEEVMPPADHPEVLTVGDLSEISSVGPTLDGREKPEILLKQAVADFSNGSRFGGSSVAAAFFAAVVATLKDYRPDLTQQRLRDYAESLRRVQLPPGMTPVPRSQLDPAYRRLVPENAVVATHPYQRWVVFTQEDPLNLPFFRGVREQCGPLMGNYILAALPYENRWGCFYPYQDPQIRHPWMEFRLGSVRSPLWRTPEPRVSW